MAEWMLPADLSAARVAREHVEAFLDERSIAGEISKDLVLIASELAANAIRHGAPPALLCVSHEHGRIRITVSNHGGSPDPRVLSPDPESGHGRGLAIVETLADDVGWSRDGDRLDVWAEIRIDATS